MSEEYIIGIDLGTTNSEVAVLKDGKIHVVEENGSPMLPSVVGLNEQGELIIGAEARNQYILRPEQTIRSIKRKMGSDEKVTLGDKSYSPQEISSMILRELKERAERFVQSPISKAVITVPAFFSDAQRQATRDAGEIAGLEVLRIVNEPTAACLAYQSDQDVASKHLLAFDLGGGTFDVSLVHMEGDVVEVVASHGDNHLGGDDVDDVLFAELLDRLADDENPKTLTLIGESRVKRAAERAKMQLSSADQVSIIEDNLQFQDGTIGHLETELHRNEMDDLILPLLKKTVACIHHVLRQANMGVKDIDECILVGGSTRLTAVHDLVEQVLGRPPRSQVNPDLAVVYGAAILAARLAGAGDHRILVDITPYTFGISGIGLLNGVESEHCFTPLIKEGTALPTSCSRTFHTVYPGQPVVHIPIFQGSDPDARNNLLVGEFRVEGLDEDVVDLSEIIVAMNLDIDGILSVSATEKHTGHSKNIRVENSLAKLSNKQIEDARRRVAEMFSDQEMEWEPAEASDDEQYNDVRSLIERVEKSMKNMDDVDREDAAKIVQELKDQMANNAPIEDFQKEITELEDILYYVESAQ